MRTPKYLSPSSIACFRQDREEFYLRYLAEHKPPKIPQSRPMSVGAAFDAYVKSYIVEQLHGRAAMEPRLQFENIFEMQVEPQNRDWARDAGKHVFNCYKQSGALVDLMLELSTSDGAPLFEFEVEGRVSATASLEGVPLLGKPDVFYRAKGDGEQRLVVHDWKVNGFCSDSIISPRKGFIMCRDGWDIAKYKPTRTHRTTHKDAQILMLGGGVGGGGLHVNCAHYLEDIDESWATQLAIYGWVLGEPVGSKFVAGIEQLVSMGSGMVLNGFPLLRVSSYRNRIGEAFQHKLFREIQEIWMTINNCINGTQPFFPEMTLEQSLIRCRMLDDYYLAYSGGSLADKWFEGITRV